MGVADMGLATQGTSLPPQCAPKLECSTLLLLFLSYSQNGSICSTPQ
jgi:hypothetical protein